MIDRSKVEGRPNVDHNLLNIDEASTDGTS